MSHVPHPLHLQNDISRAWQAARQRGFAAELKRLHQPAGWRSVAAAGFDWALIFASFAAVLAFGLAALPPALLILGNRQRALGNLLHDAAHDNFAGRHAGVEFAVRLLLFLPLCTAMGTYRREHFAHHQQLGIPGQDGDFIHDEADMGKPWPLLLWRHLTDRNIWAGSVLAHLRRRGTGERRWMLLWWSAALGALGLTLSARAALEYLLLWFAARATVFHLITTFREISDHVGLKPGTLIGFTRNHVSRDVLTHVFHPHNNGFHLVHHLFPGLPLHALPRAHTLLLAWPDYAAATHCERYFAGPKAATRSWVRAGV